jgi:hypothetical protein
MPKPIINPGTLTNLEEAQAFDRETLNSHLDWGLYLRPCFEFELPPGWHGALSEGGRGVFFDIIRAPFGIQKVIITIIGEPKVGGKIEIRGMFKYVDPLVYQVDPSRN